MNRINNDDIRVVEADLFSLTGDERQAAITALGSGSDYPLVIVGGALACTGSLDTTLIAEAIERTQSG